MTFVPLARDQHAALRVRPIPSHRFAQGSPLASLYGGEVGRAAHEFPITFTAESEGYFPAALMGLERDQNAFVDAQGRWLAGYLPAVWRRGAFRLGRLQDRDEWVLCIDPDSELISTSEGQPLFDEAGNPTAVVGQATQFLAHLEADRVATLAACAALDRHGLIVPWELTVNRMDGTKQRQNGLFKIDETKLATLDGDALADLNAAQALPLIYAHLFSMHKLALLGKLASDREAERQQQQTLQQGKLDLDRLFGIVEDDPFIF